jgi:hypothetical protein
MKWNWTFKPNQKEETNTMFEEKLGNYNVTFDMTFGLNNQIKTVETIVKIRAFNVGDAFTIAYDLKTHEASTMNRPVYALVLKNAEQVFPKYNMKWIRKDGWDVLEYNGGQSHYILWTDDNVYSINGEFFFPSNRDHHILAGVRWSFRREFDIDSDFDDARHIFLEFDKKYGRV